MTRVTAPSRLHFGLLSLPADGHDRWPGLDGTAGLPVRHFGGVGLMVDRPGLAVTVAPEDHWAATGPLASRALAVAQTFVESLPVERRRPFRITVERAPPEHTGLGVGTQLAMAVARGLAQELDCWDWGAAELAARVGRGERSAVGVYGFERGGLIVEAGKRPGEALAPLVGRYEFPADWSVLLFSPESGANWHGNRERQAFARLGRLGPSPAESEALCRLVLTGLLPALTAIDLDAFGAAVYEFNARVGDVFAAAQGGRYGSPAVADCVARLRQAGVAGVGQSSWGPTVFAFVRPADVERARAAVADVPAQLAGTSAGATT